MAGFEDAVVVVLPASMYASAMKSKVVSTEAMSMLDDTLLGAEEGMHMPGERRQRGVV